ncbi:hypothetical protein D3C73_1586540 [compost metagenome]
MGLDGFQVIDGVLADGLISLQRLDCFQADADDQADAVVHGIAGKESVVLLALGVTVALIESQMRR